MLIAVARKPLSAKIAQGDVSAWREFNGDFVNRTIDSGELLELIGCGHAYTTQHERYRDARNFVAGQHLSLDYDGGDGSCRISALADNPFISQYAAFIYTTPSHTEERPKARVFFELDRPIRDMQKYSELAQALVWKFQKADRSCKDPARFFYGSKGCEHAFFGNVLTLETAAAELVIPFRESLRHAPAPIHVPGTILSRDSVPPRVVEKHRDSLLDRVKNAPDGQKYTTLRDVATTFGGYVATGYYVKMDVERWLENAIRSNPNNVRDVDAAIRCINESIHYGMDRPLFFEDRGYTAAPDDFGNIHPPLTDSQKAQIATIVSDKVWQAYSEGMSEGERKAWRYMGFPDDVIDMMHLGVRHRTVDEDGVVTDEALAIPFLNGKGEAENVEYRSKGGGIEYESGLPSIYYPGSVFGSPDDKDWLVFGDALDSLRAYLHLGHRWNIGGLPHMTLVGDAADDLESKASRTVVVLGSDTDINGRGLKFMKGKGKFIRLPLTVDKMFQRGFNADKMSAYIRSAQLWA